MSRLEPGQPAPDFTLPSDGGDDVTLSSLRGNPVVLVFYPKAMTSGCTQQACGFRDALSSFAKIDATVLMFDSLEQLMTANPAQVRGKIVFINNVYTFKNNTIGILYIY